MKIIEIDFKINVKVLVNNDYFTTFVAKTMPCLVLVNYLIVRHIVMSG